MSNQNEYERKNQIGEDSFLNKVYKVQNKKTKQYYAMKILKKSINDNINEEELIKRIKNIYELKTENNICLKEIKKSRSFLYIYMDLCDLNLEDYIKRREDSLTINEVKTILIQLNNSFKKMFEKQIIHGYLAPKKIFISLRLDKSIIKLSNYSSNKLNINNNNIHYSTLLSMAEVLKNNDKISLKSDIWSLGIIIYYMLFKEFPFKGNNKSQIFNDISSNKKLKSREDEGLNDLLTKMLIVDENDRITWEKYLNHPFFKIESSNKHLNFDSEYPKDYGNVNHNYNTCIENINSGCQSNENINHPTNSNFGVIKNDNNKYIDLKKINENLDDILNLINETLLNKENNSQFQNDSNKNYEKNNNDILDIIEKKIEKIIKNIKKITKMKKMKKNLLKIKPEIIKQIIVH